MIDALPMSPTFAVRPAPASRGERAPRREGRGTATLLAFRPPVSSPAGSPSGPGDFDLVERLAGGDEAALAGLYDRYASLVLGFLVRLLGAAGEAEEVLQEVFLQAWRQAGRYRRELASPRGWLLMLARSRALDRLKSGQASRRREESAMVEAPRAMAPVGCERLEGEERRECVRSALEELPENQRQAIELAFFEGLSHTEIASRLGAPLGTVKSRVLLGMRKLRQLLAAELAPGHGGGR